MPTRRAIARRIRLAFALSLSLIFYPLVSASLPELPASLAGMVTALLREALTGLAIGILVRMIMSSIQFAGTIIAVQTGLAFAQNVDPQQGGAEHAVRHLPLYLGRNADLRHQSALSAAGGDV